MKELKLGTDCKDFSKCIGQNCNKKQKCFRYRAYPSSVQSYISVDDPKRCEYFVQFIPATSIRKDVYSIPLRKTYSKKLPRT